MEIHIGLAFDNNYIEQSIVLMTSILRNRKDEAIHFHILDGNLDDKVKNIILNLHDCKIDFYDFDNKIFNKYKKRENYPDSILWKILLPELVNVDKLIYLDCDIVVNSSLKDFWDIDLDQYYIAAVEDANGKKYAKRYNLKKDSKFFNSGVMLINCKKWRENSITQSAIDFALKMTGTKWGYDQTVLNHLFEDKVKFVDLKWNLQYCPINIWASYIEKQEYIDAIKNPSIIHYVGDFKPWKKGLGCFNPKQKEYFKYHKLTAFALSDYSQWWKADKLFSFLGIIAFVKRYPLFFLKRRFWGNMLF